MEMGRVRTGSLQQTEGVDHVRPSPHLSENSCPHRIEAASSDVATRAVLSQWTSSENGVKWHPISFFSKSLSPIKQNYKIHDKEMLAIICTLEEWWYYLEGTPCQFEVWMDHKNLEYFCTSKKLNRWYARWSLHLSQFNFTLHHHPGYSMGKSDTLSHRVDHRSGGRDNMDMTMLPPSLFAIRALKGVTAIRAKAEVLQDI